VSFGPKTKNFRDVVSLLLDAGAATVVHDGAELTAFARHCLDDPAWAAESGRRAAAVVASQLGATRRTADLLDALLVHEKPASLDRRTAA
jgi:3-deoxy-D-manno-octulosonic-acid transferase